MAGKQVTMLGSRAMNALGRAVGHERNPERWWEPDIPDDELLKWAGGQSDERLLEIRNLGHQSLRWIREHDVARERVECDDACGAFEEPRSLEETKAALDHWRSHGCLSGCSHAR